MAVTEPRSVSDVDDPPPSLLGRDEELARLDRIGGELVVRGDAGIGKTAMLAAASERAHALGVLVLSASGVESEAQLPFAGLHQLLLPSLHLLTELPEPQR